jgi:hypothetical protein
MARRFIQSSQVGNSRSLTPLSKPSAQSYKNLQSPVCNLRLIWTSAGRLITCSRPRFSAAKTPKALPPTPDIRRCATSSFGHWMLGVGYWMFQQGFSRRVMGAWWPPRSSKPPSACFASRGMFDSYPLRQLHSRCTIYDLRFHRVWLPSDHRLNRKPQIAIQEGGVADVPRADS